MTDTKNDVKAPPPGDASEVERHLWPVDPGASEDLGGERGPVSPEKRLEEKAQKTLARFRLMSDRAKWDSVINMRRRLGYGIGALGILTVLGVGGYNLWCLHKLAEMGNWTMPLGYLAFVVGGHVAITLVLGYFGYVMLRASERLIIPYQWVEEMPEATRMMLGMTDPASSGAKALEKSAESLGVVLKPVADLLKVVNGIDKK